MPEETKSSDFDFENWLKEGMTGFKHSVKNEMPAFNFADVRTHIRNAQKEQLLAMRSFIDSAIDWLDKDEKNEA